MLHSTGSVTYGVLQSFDANQVNERKTWEAYLTSQAFHNLSKDLKTTVLETRNAIGCVLTGDGQCNGTALLIGPGLILVPKHCVPGESGNIKFSTYVSPIQAQTLIDGEIDAPSAFRGDYKILYTNQVHDLKPAKLSVSKALGQSLQINYQVDGELYVTPYESVESFGGYATRSDFSSVITINGDSGGAKLSLSAKAVHGIHQGESEALTINQIYHSLQAIQKENPSKGQVIQHILNALNANIVDIEMLGMHFSSVFLQPGQVIPERHGTLEAAVLSKEGVYKVPSSVTRDILNFFSSFKTLEAKRNFYSIIWCGTGTVYQLPTYASFGTRLDSQSPRNNAGNLQIQVKGQTVATVLVSNELAKYANGNDQKIAEVVNYITFKFFMAIKNVVHHDEAIVVAIALLGRVQTLQ